MLSEIPFPRHSKAAILSIQQPGRPILSSFMLPNFQNKCPTSAASSSHLLHSGNPPQSGHRPQGSLEEARMPGSPTQCLPSPLALAAPLGPNLPHQPQPMGIWNPEHTAPWFTFNSSIPVCPLPTSCHSLFCSLCLLATSSSSLGPGSL